MRGSLGIILGAAFLAATAGAQQGTSQQAPANSNATTAQPAPATAVSADPGATTAATVTSDQAPKFAMKNFSVQLYNWSELKMDKANRNTGEMETQNYVGLSYKLSKDNSITVRQPWITGDEFQTTRKNMYFILSDSNLGTLPGGVAMSGSAIYYAPTAENVGDAGHRGIPSVSFVAAKDITDRLSVAYNIQPFYWLNTRNEKISETVTPTGALNRSVSGNADFRLINQVGLDYKIMEKLIFSQAVVLDQTWFRPAEGGTIRGERTGGLDLYTYMTVPFTPSISVNFGLYNSQDFEQMNRGEMQFSAFRENQTSYYLETSIRY